MGDLTVGNVERVSFEIGYKWRVKGLDSVVEYVFGRFFWGKILEDEEEIENGAGTPYDVHLYQTYSTAETDSTRND